MNSIDLNQLINIRSQYLEHIRHLQNLRFKLISIFFLILGGTGFLINTVINNLGINKNLLLNSSLFWIISSIIILLLVILSSIFGIRTAQYTITIRKDIIKIRKIGNKLLYKDKNAQQRNEYSEKIRMNIIGWPVGISLFSFISSSLIFVYVLLLLEFLFTLSLLISSIIALIFAIFVFIFNLYLYNNYIK